MRKFVIAAVLLGLIFLGLRYSVYYRGYYIDLDPDMPVTVQQKIENKTIYIANEEGEYDAFIIKGVDLASSIPGHRANDYMVDSETWQRWFAQIQEMGANTIRIYTIYNDVFYNAFYEYNAGREKPLYLLQGIQVSDYANNSSQDAYSSEFYGLLKKDAMDAVDVIHGKKNISINSMKGSGTYRKNVSPWVIGYLVGNEWNSGTIAYTNQNSSYETSYEGTYFTTTKEATAFEAMLAKVMDDMVSYESNKYKMQRLISFVNDPQNDPFEYELFYARQLDKFNHMDAEHIVPTGELKSGYFASYRLYEYRPEFMKYLKNEQNEKITAILQDINQDYYYDGYTKLLADYHSIPVVITSYGFSSSRGTDEVEGPMTEVEQGQAIIATYHDIVASGCNGAFINSWQDSWERRTWNTAYAVDVMESYRFHDKQTIGQGYGLLSFDLGSLEDTTYVDGDASEWSKKDQVMNNEEGSISVRYDAAYLYLLVEKKGLSENTPIYLPIDTTPKSGSTRSDKLKLNFEREADFLLSFDGRNNSRLLVQARYESVRANYLTQITGEDPYVSYPDKESNEFVPIQMICKNDKLMSEHMTVEEVEKVRLYDTHETGKLTLGNGNPNSKEYNSLADFCYGTDLVEVRIPWQLLNFYNPADMLIHADYYQNYGIEGIKTEELYVGLGEPNRKQPMPMAKVKLSGWHGKISYHERLKQSYYIVQESWGE